MKKKNVINKINTNVIIIVVITAIIIFIIAVLLLSRNLTQQDNTKYMATVNNQEISLSEYKQVLDRVTQFYSWSGQDVNNIETIQKDALDRLIEQKIAHEFAIKNNIKVNEKELLQRYKDTLGKKDEEQYLKLINDMYGMSKQDFLQNLSNEILKEKIQTLVKKPFVVWVKETKKRTSIQLFPAQ